MLLDIKEEVTVSPKGGNPTSKTSHFINPRFSSTQNPPTLPTISLPFRPALPNPYFNGWRNGDEQWVSWLEKMRKVHSFKWKEAGIYEAILSSRYRVVRNDELVFGLCERWCFETNAFVFCWGECTLTLEDIRVLSGLSVLGKSVCMDNNDKQVLEVESRLLAVYNSLRKTGSEGVDQGAWMKTFMGRSGLNEHEAFLCLWLSRFVLPCYPYNSISTKCFKIAVCLSKGIEIALAPVVLSSIYRDLSLFKSAMENVGKLDEFNGEKYDDLLLITLWSPLQLVQVWAWERFPEFRPKPRDIVFGEPRIARWHDVNKEDFGSVRSLLQSSGDSFEWRPYCKHVKNLALPSWVSEDEQYILMNEKIGKDVKIMAQFLRVTELVGLESIEQYNPHRVSMQFGFDQDLPDIVKRDWIGCGIPQKELEQLAWVMYSEPIVDKLLYIPPRSYEPQVTLRYLKWLRGGNLTRKAAFEGIKTRKRGFVRLRQFRLPRLLFEHDEVNSPPRIRPRNVSSPEIDVQPDESRNSIDEMNSPPRISPGNVNASEIDESGNSVDVPSGLSKSIISSAFDVPPGFSPNSVSVKKRRVEGVVGHVHEVPPGFEPLVKVKKECIESRNEVQALVTSRNLTEGIPPGYVKSNQEKLLPNVAGESSRKSNEVVSREISPAVTHIRSMVLGGSRKNGSDFEPSVKVKKEGIPPGSVKSNQEKISPNVAGESSGKSNEVIHRSKQLSVEDQLKELEKMVADLRESS